MDTHLQSLLKSYEKLPVLHRNVVDTMTVRFILVDGYNGVNALKQSLYPFCTLKNCENALKALLNQNLLVKVDGKYDVDLALKLEIYPGLIRQERFAEIAKSAQNERTYSWNITAYQNIRDFLFGLFVEKNRYSEEATIRLCDNIDSASPVFRQMLEMPVYVDVLKNSPVLYNELMKYMHRFNLYYFQGFESAMQLFEQIIEFNGFKNLLKIQKAEIVFQRGMLSESFNSIAGINTHESLLLHSQIELFRGEFSRSASTFERARVTDDLGGKMLKKDLDIYYEFFYWLGFLFYPEGLDIKKLDIFIKKADKRSNDQYMCLLPLLYLLKMDRIIAEEKLILALKYVSTRYASVRSLFCILLDYIISGDLNAISKSLVPVIYLSLRDNGQWLFLRELTFIMEKSGIEADPVTSPLDRIPETPPCLMSRLTHQEKWEQRLDELLTFVDEKSEGVKKEAGSSRICYLIDIDSLTIQPILQTMNSKGIWSAGRNIALKRFSEQQIEGLTLPDRRVAASITYTSGYYGATEYTVPFDNAMVELCGHPLIFLYSNPSVSVELVKAQPEIITENLRSGIRIKTNITDPAQDIIVIKETQTRFKVISLSPQQQRIIKIIDKGITIPAKGKEKLLKTVSGLSGIMTVHSDITDETSAGKIIEADSRIRFQIVPIGDGLKAEMFVKPLGTEPPYMKPARGGKMVYGIIGGQKCQAKRNMMAETSNANTLINAIDPDMDSDLMEDVLTFNDPYQCLNLLEVLGQHRDIAVVEWPEGEHFRIRKSVSFGNFNFRVKGKGQWFELEGELNVDEETIISLKELLDLNRKSKGRFIELKKGEFVALTEELKKQLEELNAFSSTEKGGVKINPFAAHSIDDLTNQAASFKADKAWKDFQKKIKEADSVEVSVPATLDGELRAYQEEGYRWMTRLNAWGAGACLADDMGLGKTIQAIALMLQLAENGPALVVCPASVLPNWGNELRKFAPTLNPVILKAGNREETFASLAPFDVLVTTYGLLQTEEERIAGIQWNMAVLDEAHAIKNTQTKSSKAAMNIQSGFKLALTGTPIQNHLGELWNLFNFCNPGLLGTLPQFTDRFIKNDSPSQKAHLKKLIAPFILRRTKNKVLDELPPKTEITFSVDLSDAEMAFYETLRREAIKTIENNEGPGGHQHLQALAEITKLRLACCNSKLVNKGIQLPSSKLEALLEIIAELRANKHRALVFSQFVMHLAIVRQEFDKLGITYQYLDGSTPIPEREKAVKAFQSGKGDLFLISLKAGGLGLNLTAADYVLHLDPWWNPAVEDQASDRTHRIGQTRPVTIYRLVAKNTIEEKIVQLHATKRDLADSLLEGTDQSARLSTADLLSLLKEI